MKKALLLIQLSIFLVTACKEESSNDYISELSTERREVLIESKGNTAYYDFQKNTSCITPLITE